MPKLKTYRTTLFFIALSIVFSFLFLFNARIDEKAKYSNHPQANSSIKQEMDILQPTPRPSFRPLLCSSSSGNCDCLQSIPGNEINKCNLESNEFNDENLVRISVSDWLTEGYYSPGYYKCPNSNALVVHNDPVDANVVVRTDTNAFPPYTRLDQLHALLQMENLVNKGPQYSDRLMNVDIPISYRDTPLQVSYIENSAMEFRTFTYGFSERKSAAVWIASNCDIHSRNDLVSAIAKLFPVDILGSCMNTASIEELYPDCYKFHYNQHYEKQCILSKYKFTLAFENSADESYITEKLWQPLLVGSIPVYSGAPNVESFIPFNSAINVKNYPDTNALVMLMNDLASNKDKYNEYLDWKKREFSQGFLEKINISFDTLFCRLSDLVSYRTHSIKCIMDVLNTTSYDLLYVPDDAPNAWAFIDVVFITHYTRIPSRLDYMKSWLKQFNSPTILLKDFDREDLTSEQMDCVYPSQERRIIDHRSWKLPKCSSGETSLSVKHFAAFKYIYENKIERGLIFEDDAAISPDMLGDFSSKFKKVMDTLPSDYDMFFVGGCFNLHCESPHNGNINNPVACKTPYQRSRCTHAYVVSHRGAEKMLKNLPLRWPIDFLINDSPLKLETYWAEPPLFIQLDSLMHSDIREK